MYKWGMIACLFIVLLVGVCGCSAIPPGTNKTPGGTSATPTLPETYIAGESTPLPVSSPVAATPTPANASSVNIQGAQANATLTAVTIACTGLTCTSGSTNSTGTASEVNAPVSTFSSNITMAYFKQNPFLAVQFAATGTNTPPYSWMWSWTGGNVSSSGDPALVLVFNQYGYYVVSRTITNTLGTSSNSTTISVCPLVASFTTNQTAGLVPLTVQFTDTSTDQPLSWSWDFGDGGTSTLQNPVHTYTTSGDYTVRLEATNSLGSCWNTGGISVLPLTASFATNQTTGLAPLTVQFTDTSTDQPTSWSWLFGDGAISSLQNPVHTYTTSGVYTVNMNATNGHDGWRSSQPGQITVYTLPVVLFNAAPTTGTPGTSVIFSDQSSGFPGPTSWYWDFGDGYTSTYQNPSHQYTSSGSYTISHSATNAQGTTWLNKTAFITIS